MKNEEKRVSKRQEKSSSLVIEVLLTEDEHPLILYCESSDISDGGFKAITPTFLPDGLVVEVCMHDKQLAKHYLLYAEVKWSSLKGDLVETGFLLLDVDCGDLPFWLQELIDR